MNFINEYHTVNRCICTYMCLNNFIPNAYSNMFEVVNRYVANKFAIKIESKSFERNKM